MSVVLELLRVADLNPTSRTHRVTTLTQWCDRFLGGGEAGMKSREVGIDDEENRQLKSVVAILSVDNELLREKITHLEGNRRFAFWKSKPCTHSFAFQHQPYGRRPRNPDVDLMHRRLGIGRKGS